MMRKEKETARTFARDPNMAMREMMETIDALKGIYILETEALDAADAGKFLQLQESKINAAKQYQEGFDALMERKEEIKAANPALKRRLADMQIEFSELSVRNLNALKRMQRCTERLGEVIMGSARETAKKGRAVAYGENGVFSASDKKSVSMGVSETA